MTATDAQHRTAQPVRTAARPRPWVAPLALGLAGPAAVGLGVAVDSSSLQQASESWGYGFAGFVLACYGFVPWLLTLLTAVLARVSPDERSRQVWVLAGAWVTALCGGAVVLLSGWVFLDSDQAGRVYASGMVGIGACLVGQLAPALRRPALRG